MKINKSKGFTLIELMVVISIIALLSSVVLASIKSARDKADNTRIVSEMKSLQTALELYKARFGTYPQENVDEDDICSVGYFCGGFNDFVKTYLVDNKFIPKVLQSKNYPNNCIDNNCYMGNLFSYWSSTATFQASDEVDGYTFYYMCGGQKVSNYALIYVTSDKLNLPKFTYNYNGNIATGYTGSTIGEEPVNEYCLSM